MGGAHILLKGQLEVNGILGSTKGDTNATEILVVLAFSLFLKYLSSPCRLEA
jgi:hypothetical protein